MFRLFKHPSQVCMTYYDHMKLSLNLSSYFLEGSMKALVHAFIPDLYITSSTDVTKKITQKMKKAGCRKEDTQHS